MKKVLVITYAFPPSNNVGIHRVLRMGKWLPKYGWEPVILTSENPFTGRLDPENNIFADKYFDKVYRCDSKFNFILNRIADLRKRDLLALLIRGILLKNLIPDRSILWKRRAVKKGLEIIEKENIQAIWATVGPMTSGIVGSILRKKTNTPLFIDYRDPWTLQRLNSKHSFKFRVNQLMEFKMLTMADMVGVTSIPMKELFIENNYYNGDRISVITNSYDEELQNILINDEKTGLDTSKINITYTGSFYGSRQPFSFLEGLKELIFETPEIIDKVRVNFIGDNIYPENIIEFNESIGGRKIIQFIGTVSYKKAMRYILDSDILLLINGKSERNNIFIPGKLFDYLAANKPILFIGKGQPADIISELGIGRAVPHEPELIKNSLKELIKKRDGCRADEKIKVKYSSKEVTRKLADTLNLISQQN